jgi:hypothetical protein
MSDVRYLTPEEEKLIPIIAEKWKKIGFSTDPTNRGESEKYIREAYVAAGVVEPKRIIWGSSPKDGLTIASALLYHEQSSGTEINPDKLTDENIREYTAIFLAAIKEKNDQATKCANECMNSVVYGSHDAGWLSFYDLFIQIGINLDKMKPLIEAAKVCGWFWPFDVLCVATNKPTKLHVDDRNRLHSIDEAAIDYGDGFAIYSVHGVNVPAHIIDNPEKITIQEIDAEKNAEVRRVMIEQYGRIRTKGDTAKSIYLPYALDSGMKAVAEDEIGVLYRKDVPDDEPIVMVKVVNSTPESDGSYKEYFLRVDPNAKSAREAIAGTFGLKGEEYQPQQEA